MSTVNSKRKWINTAKFLAGYLVAAWTFLQFLEWVLNRYGISPNWVDLFLWIFIGLVPSFAIYFHHQDRINKGIIKLKEKIVFPANLILLIVVIYIGFYNSDLGATTKEISYTNSEGELEKPLLLKKSLELKSLFIVSNRPKKIQRIVGYDMEYEN